MTSKFDYTVFLDLMGSLDNNSPSIGTALPQGLPIAPVISAVAGSLVSGSTVHVTGVGLVGSTIKLYANGGATAIATVTVGLDGLFDIPCVFADGFQVLTATETVLGLVSLPSEPKSISVLPLAPTITALIGLAINCSTVHITGTGAVGSTITLFANGGVTAIGTATVSLDGKFDIPCVFSDGIQVLTATATDLSGLISAPCAPANFTILPGTPVIRSVTGQLVNGTTLHVSGTGEAGTTVSLFANGGTTVVGSGVVSAGGTFDVITSAFADGNYSLTVTAKSSLGLTSAPCSSVPVVINPNAPTVSSTSAGLVNGSVIEVKGTGEAGTTVSLFANGGTTAVGSGVVSAGGTFDITTSAFADGNYAITASAKDGVGLTSAPSAAAPVVVNPNAPSISSTSAGLVNGSVIEVKGTGEAGTTVSLFANSGTTAVGSGLVSAGGTFDIITSAFADGNYALTASAKDSVGLISATSAGFAASVGVVKTSWKSPVNGDWSVASNWTSGITPNDFNTDATIAIAGTYTVAVMASKTFEARSLTLSNAKATLDLAGTIALSSGLTLNAGTVKLDHGGKLAGSISLAAKSILTGYGRITGSVVNSGSITVTGGNLVIEGPVSGSKGTISIAKSSLVELGGSVSGQNVLFMCPDYSVIKIDSPSSMTSQITAFSGMNVIDLAKISATSDRYVAGVLYIFNGSGPAVASLKINTLRPFQKQIFALSSDGAGGVNISLAPDVAPVIIAPQTFSATVLIAKSIAGVTLTDANALVAGETFTVTVTDKSGVLSVNGNPGFATVTGAGTSTLVVSGSMGQVAQDLAALTYLGTSAGADKVTLTASNGLGEISQTATIMVTIGAAAAAIKPSNASLFSQVMAGLTPEIGINSASSFNHSAPLNTLTVLAARI